MVAAAAALGAAGCAQVLGIDDPTPDFGGDGGAKTLASISIEPDPLELPLGVTRQLTATGHFDDDSTADITAQVMFSVSDGSTVTVTPDGMVTAIAQGPSTVAVALGKVTGNAIATVGVAVPTHLAFAFGDFRMAQGQRVRLRVTATFTDGTMGDATGVATYASNAPATATVDATGQVTSASVQGTAAITASYPGATPATLMATVTAKQCAPVINEFTTGNATGADEYAELLNPCSQAIDVTGWTLVYRASTATGATDSNLMIALTGSMAPGALRLYAGQDYGGQNDGKWPGSSGILQQNNGAIAIRAGAQNTGAVVDSVAYGTVSAGHPFIEGAVPASAMANGLSAQRQPFDGRDEDKNDADFTILTTGTPGASNAP